MFKFEVLSIKWINKATEEIIYETPQVPIRKHKKKRIQKKWIKKYGMKPKHKEKEFSLIEVIDTNKFKGER